jgi:5-methyltetrahydrofolate--homocysteine methyltransferase
MEYRPKCHGKTIFITANDAWNTEANNSMQFTQDKWQKIKYDAALWWAGQLGRPLIQVRLEGKQPDRPESKYPAYPFTSFYDFSVGPDEIIDAWDYQLCCTEYLGDAFPVVVPNFGPGVIAAYMGACLQNGSDTVWFHPEKELELSGLNFEYLPNNKWLLRTKQILHAAVNRWQGGVQIAMTDLGGNMDILSVFRPSEKLLLDLFDNADKVEQLNWQGHKLWWRYFDEFNAITVSGNPGYSSWARIFSETSHYMLQCDFCYMIGPKMFDRFVKPELVATSEKMSNAFYHLDGPGQLCHLESLLEIETIKGIQWVPGAGQPDASQWPHVYRKITNAGKLIHIASGMAEDPFTLVDAIAQQTGRADNIVYHFDGSVSQIDRVMQLLETYHCD